MDMNGITVDWVIEESEAQAFAESVRNEDAPVLELKRWEPGPDELDDYGDAQFEPLTVAVVTIAVGWLISRIASVTADQKRPGGQLVDTRDGILIRPLPKAARGTLVIVTDERAQVFTPDRQDEGLSALTTLLASSHG